MSVVAVVTTYTRQELVRQCLDGIPQQSQPVAAITLVDNASSDSTADDLRHRLGDQFRSGAPVACTCPLDSRPMAVGR
jgi:GT2 family glycosyltransferase